MYKALALLASCWLCDGLRVASDCASQDLGGAMWTVTNVNGSVAIPATVPGQVHLDLLRAGIIRDPYEDNATETQQWVRDESWTYFRNLSIDPAVSACRHVLVVAEGLDTIPR